MSSSHSRFTVSDQLGIFWTSSSANTAPRSGASRARSRAASHWAVSQLLSRRVGSSALTNLLGRASSSSTCRTRVVLPTCRGPATTSRNRRGSATRAAKVAPKARRNVGVAGLLAIVSSFTQHGEQ